MPYNRVTQHQPLSTFNKGWDKITSLNFKVIKKTIRDIKILFLDSETTTWEVLNHSFKKSILEVVVIVNTLLQADSDISHYFVKHIMRYAGYFQADCIL